MSRGRTHATLRAMTRRDIVILGGGTGGTMVANRLRRRLGAGEARIRVVDRDDRHVYQPGLLFVPFGLADAPQLVRPRHRQLHPGIEFHQAEVGAVDTDSRNVELADGSSLRYDVLIVATGAELQPGETDGLLGSGWNERAFTFYTPQGAALLRPALERLEHGRLVVNFVDLPIKCPVAPLEFAFLADWHLRERGIRNRVELAYVTPLDGAFTTPVCAEALAGLFEEKEIELVTEFNACEVDGAGGVLTSYDGRTVDFDLLVTVPLHGGPRYVELSGLGDGLGFVRTDRHTLQTLVQPDVFALGDATDLPISKAGSVTHFEAEVLAANVARHLAGEELAPDYDGHANCFVETGFQKALLIDFNYETEPLPGRFPTALGPLPLLRESHLNHLGKLAFQWAYWHALLPGHDIPAVGPRMPTTGKKEVTSR